MFFKLALFLFWPLLQGNPQYIELSKFWKIGVTIETGMAQPLAVLTCPSTDSISAGWLVAADSSGKLAEIHSDGTSWSIVRSFSAGTPLVCICSGAPLPDMEFRLYGGTKTGQIIEVSRGAMGWSKREILQLPGPIRALYATEAGGGGVVSVLLAIDGNGQIHQLVPPFDAANKSGGGPGRWTTQSLPDLPGGASFITAHKYGERLWSAAAGPSGDIYRYYRDTLGQWSGSSWAKMPVGPKSFAAASDPSFKDIAIYYSGIDRRFRFLFLGFTDDKKARVPAADGITNVIGVGSQRRFNEFFGISGNEFCMFEFNFDDKAWHKVPISEVDLPVVSTTFGHGFNDVAAQMYVLGANGKIREYVRYKN